MASICRRCYLIYGPGENACTRCNHRLTKDSRTDEEYLVSNYRYAENQVVPPVERAERVETCSTPNQQVYQNTNNNMNSQIQPDFFAERFNNSNDIPRVNQPGINQVDYSRNVNIPRTHNTIPVSYNSRTNTAPRPRARKVKTPTTRQSVNVPWRVIFALILVIIIIGIIYYIWSLRYVILNSVVNFAATLVSALLPFGLLLYFLYRVIFPDGRRR